MSTYFLWQNLQKREEESHGAHSYYVSKCELCGKWEFRLNISLDWEAV